MKSEGSAKPDPDPLASWFDMLRLKSGASCEDLAAAIADGKLTKTRPF